jgi:hypothetical protein
MTSKPVVRESRRSTRVRLKVAIEAHGLSEPLTCQLFRELAAHDHVYGLVRKRPGIVPVESRESFYIQAADIAAGIASQIYGIHGLIGVLEKFEYVTYNGIRVSRSDAEEEMRKLAVID